MNNTLSHYRQLHSKYKYIILEVHSKCKLLISYADNLYTTIYIKHKYMYMYMEVYVHCICHDEATLQSFWQSHKCDTCTMVWDVHCVVCGFIKLYKHDFEVTKYIGYVMPTCAIISSPSSLWLGDYKPDIAPGMT